MIAEITQYLRCLGLSPWLEGQDLPAIAAQSYEPAVQYGIDSRSGFLGCAYLYYKTHSAFAEYPAIQAGQAKMPVCRLFRNSYA